VRGEVYAGFWWGNLRDRNQLEDPDVGGRIIVRGISGGCMGGWIGLIWLRRGTGGVLL